MSQKKINNYFELIQTDEGNEEAAEPVPIVLEEDSSDSDSVPSSLAPAQHFSKYEELLRKNQNAKNDANIALTEMRANGSIVWKYFGTLILRQKPVLQSYRFCKLCFEMDLTILKG